MAKILRFKEPTAFTPLDYRGLDTIPVFIAEEGGKSYDYFGFTKVPEELAAGRNLLALTGTKNLVPGSEIAIEVLDPNGNLIPVRTFDHIGFGNERVFSIEVAEGTPEGDAVITVCGVVKGKVAYDSAAQRNLSERMPRRFSNQFNIRWTKRLNCYPRKRNTSDLVFFPNPDITIEEIKRPYWKLNYNQDLASTPQNQATNSFELIAPFTNSQEIQIDVKDGFIYRFIAASPTATPPDSSPVFFFGTGSSIAEDVVAVRDQINQANIGVIAQTGSSTAILGITSSAPGVVGNLYTVFTSSFSVLLNTASACITHESISMFRSQSNELSSSGWNFSSGSFFVGHEVTDTVRFAITGSQYAAGANNITTNNGVQPTIFIPSGTTSTVMANTIVSHFNFSSSLFAYSSSIGHMSASYENEELCFHSKIPSGSDGNNYVFQTTSSNATVHTVNLSGGVGHTHGPFSTSLQMQLGGGTQTFTSVNTGSTYSLVSTGSISDSGQTNTSTNIKYEVQGDKYFLFCEPNPDFGGFTDDMVGGTIFFPKPVSPYPAAYNGPFNNPLYNELEDGDGNGSLDTGSGQFIYTNQGAFATYIIERISPLQVRVNSPHTTFQGLGRENQKEVFHQKFDYSPFRLDWGQDPVSKEDSLSAKDRLDENKKFYTSYAYVQFNHLTPLTGDVTRIKTYIRNDQTVNDYHLVGDNPVFAPELLIQSASLRSRFPAGDFSSFGVSSSLHQYWTSSTSPGSTTAAPQLIGFKMNTDNLQNPVVESLQIGDSTPNSSQALSGNEYWTVESSVPMTLRKDQYYQVSFKAFAIRTSNSESASPNLDVYLYGDAVKDDDICGKQIGTIERVNNVERIDYPDPLDFNISKGEKFTFKADATEFAYLKFKINRGLWYLSDISVKPFDHFGYTPHYFDAIIPTTKGNVNTKDALDFRFEFYNDDHRKATYTADIKNVEFDNEFTFTATSVFFSSASIDTFFGNTPIGDNDWIKERSSSAILPHEQPQTHHPIYHEANVGVGDFSSTTVDHALHIKRKQLGGNTVIKAESFSSSILELASDIGGAGPASRSAYIIINQNNYATASIIGYTDKENKDPGGATMTGVSKGSFVIHERHARVMAFGVGSTSPLQLATGKSSNFANIGYGGVFVGHRNVQPGSFEYELDISGSNIIRSGTLFLPDAEVTTSAGVNYLLGTKDAIGRTKKVTLDSVLVGDMDWHIQSTYISQSRVVGTAGRTVVISDGPDVNSAIAPNSYIFQVSQSSATPRVQLLGIPSGSITRILGLDDAGRLITTGSTKLSATSAGGGDDNDWHVHTNGGTAHVTSSRHVNVTGSITASSQVVASLFKGGDRNESRGTFGSDVHTLQGSLVVGEWNGSAMGVSHVDGGAESLIVGAGNTVRTDNLRAIVVGLNNSSSGHASITVGSDNYNDSGDQTLIAGSSNRSNGSKISALIGSANVATTQDLQFAIGAGLHMSSSTGGFVAVGKYNRKYTQDASFIVGVGPADGARQDALSCWGAGPGIGTHFHLPTVTTASDDGGGVGIGLYPAYHLDIREQESSQHPVRVRTFNKAGGSLLTYNKSTGIITFADPDSANPIDKDIKIGHASADVFFLNPNSPTMQFISGSLQLISSTATTSSNQGYYTGSAIIGEVKTDPNDDKSFYISSSLNQSASMYFSGSGRLGFGTTDPKSDFEVVADDIRFVKRSADRGIKMNKEGNFESFAQSADAAQTGSEYILMYTRGTPAAPQKAQIGDVMGSIRWTMNSGSLALLKRSSGEAAKIRVVAAAVTDTGVAGDMEFQIDTSEASNLVPATALALRTTGTHEITGSLNLSGNILHQGATLDIANQLRHLGDPDTNIQFTTNVIQMFAGNNSNPQITIGGTGVIFNQNHASGYDFRVEGDDDTHLIFADAGIDKVGIGTSTPEEKLHVVGNVKVTGNIIAQNYVVSSSVTNITYQALSGSTIFGDTSDDTHTFTGNITSSGNIVSSGTGSFAYISASGNISASGDIAASNIFLPDGGKIRFGNSHDFSISHDGSDSVLYDSGTGGTKFRSSQFRVMNANNNETLIDAVENSHVKLYHNNSEKLSTKATGIDITGDITASVNISASGNITAAGYIGQRVNIAYASSNISSPTQNLMFYGGSNGLSSNTWNVGIGQTSGSYGQAYIPPQYINNLHIIPCAVKDVTLKSNQRCGHTQNPTIWIYTGSIHDDSNAPITMGFAASQSIHGITGDGETNGSGQRSYHINITGSKSFTPNPGHELMAVFMKNEGSGTQAWRFNYRLDGITTE